MKYSSRTLWNRRQTLWLLTGFSGGLMLNACQQPGPETTTESPTASSGEAQTDLSSADETSAAIGTTLWIGFAPLFVALEKGFFAQRGLELSLNTFGGNTESDAAFAAGQLEFQGNVTSEAVALASRGTDYRIVMVADTSLGGDGILARNSIKDIADFKGKSVAVEEGGVSHFFLLQVLSEAGLSADDVEIINTVPDAAAAAYQAGKTDIAVTYAPFLQQSNQAQPDGRIIYDTSKMPTAILDVFLVDTKLVEENPAAVQAFVAGIAEALDFLNAPETRDEGLAIAADRLELTPEDLAAELEGVDLTSIEKNLELLGNPDSDQYLAKHMEAIGQFLVGQGQIDAVPDNLNDVIDPRFVQAI